MYTNGVSTQKRNTYVAASTDTNRAEVTKSTENTAEKDTGIKKEPAAVYEAGTKSNAATGTTKRTKAQNDAIVKQLKADMEQRKRQLEETVLKMIHKQAISWNTSQSQSGINIYDVLRSGNFTADADTIAQAKKDVAEDGYWGVEQTSDRILSFAKALAGDDPTKADELLNAFKKGFEQATGAWGGKLPDISQRTYDAVVKKFDQWKYGDQPTTEASETKN